MIIALLATDCHSLGIMQECTLVSTVTMTCVTIKIILHTCNWGEPERAPH